VVADSSGSGLDAWPVRKGPDIWKSCSVPTINREN